MINRRKRFIFIIIIIGILFFGTFKSLSHENYISKTILKARYGAKNGEFGFSDPGPFIKNAPGNFVIDNKGNIFIEDHLNYRIQKFNKNGKFLLAFGKQGKGKGEFGRYINKLGIDGEDNLYAADYWNYRIQKFDNDGNYVLDFKTLGVDEEKQKHIEDLKVMPSGRIYANDFKTGWQAFDSKGNFLGKPLTINEDRKGNSYTIAAKRNGKEKFKIKLTKYKAPQKSIYKKDERLESLDIDLEKYAIFYNGLLGFDKEDNFYICFIKKQEPEKSLSECFIKKFDENGKFVAQIDLKTLSFLSTGNPFFLDRDGNIYQMNQTFDGIEIVKYYQKGHEK